MFAPCSGHLWTFFNNAWTIFCGGNFDKVSSNRPKEVQPTTRKKPKRPSQKELVKKYWAHPKEVQATKIENKFKQPSREETQATNSKGSPSAHPKRSWLKKSWAHQKEAHPTKIEKKLKQPSREEAQATNSKRKSKRPSQKELVKKSWAHPKEVQETKIENKFKQPRRE